MFLACSGQREYMQPKHLPLSWFIGGFFGALLGAILCNRIQKKKITCFAAVLVTISGILLVAASPSYDAMLAARYLNGGAAGLVFPLTFVLAGEQVVKSMRGMNAAATDSMCFSLGVVIQIIYSNVWPDGSFAAMQITGFLSILWGFIGFICAFKQQIESPILYLARGQHEMAIDTLRRLQRPFTVTHDTYEQLEEHKRYLAESEKSTLWESIYMGLPALIKLCFYRSFTAMSFSFYTHYAFSYATAATYPHSMWSYYTYGCLRLLGTSWTVFTLDSKGRKPPMIVGFFLCSFLAFGAGVIFDLFRRDAMTSVMYLLMAYQFFAGLSTASSSAYLSEAFHLAIKPYYVAIVFMVEMSFHIVTIACSSRPIFVDLPAYFYSVGALSLVFFIVAIVAMPETKWNTLRECLMKFRKLVNNGSYYLVLKFSIEKVDF